jgi:PAS domain S-box-containing protein
VAIGIGNTLEALVGAYLIKTWAGGRDVFDTPIGVAKFALIVFAPSTTISATIGVTALSLAGFVPWSQLPHVWVTWWLGDLTGALVIVPVIVLWAVRTPSVSAETAAIFLVAVCVGVIAFSPLIGEKAYRDPLGFLAIGPLLWASLRRDQRDTATAVLILAAFAIWGTARGSGPFAGNPLNASFLLVLMFLISISVPSLALAADVSARRRAETNMRRARDELLQAEIRHRTEIESELSLRSAHLAEAQRLAHLGSWSWDIQTGKIDWSDQLHKIYGLEPGAFRGTVDDFVARIHADDRARIHSAIASMLQSTEASFSHEERIVRPNGEVRHLQSSGEMISDADGRPRKIIGICHDVTEWRQDQAALEAAREQLATSQKMEALGELTGGIAHDFNNLLMIVGGHAQMLRRGVGDPRLMRAVDAIQTAARRGETLTRQLLAFSRREHLSPVVVSIGERLHAMRSMLRSSLRDNISLAIDVAADLWPVEVDVAQFELAIVNIAVNARDAMPDGGEFRLAGRRIPSAERPAALPLAGDFVALSLSDTGVGMPDEIQSKVFDPFFTTKEVGRGTGLGLSQVYGFVHQSGGIVTLESKLGSGTTITIFLPRSRREPAEDAPPPVVENPVMHQGDALVVDDDPEVAEVTASLLEQLGYQVACVSTGDGALKLLDEGRAFHLVVSDVVMPGSVNGFALAREIGRRHPDTPVLLTSAYSHAAESGPAQVPILRKPFVAAALDQAIRGLRAGR